MDGALDVISALERAEALIADLCHVWEASVRATHALLADADIVALRPEVDAGLRAMGTLEVALLDGEPCGFSGVQDGKLEMLFVAPEARGRGVGKVLLARAVELHGARALDVNEQNPQAIGFYEHEGFAVCGRLPVDDAGRPFPLLHMRLAGKGREEDGR